MKYPLIFHAFFAILPLCAFEITDKTIVVIPEKPEKSTVLAASELVQYVMKSSKLKLRNEPFPGTKNRIVIGTLGTVKNLPADLAEKLVSAKAGGTYCIAVRGNTMYIVGKEKVGELYGVYQFLEEKLGIRWFKPANAEDDGEYIPECRRIEFPDYETLREPAFTRRLLVPTAWNWTDQPVNGVIWSVRGGFQMRAAYYHDTRMKRKTAAQEKLYAPRTGDVWENNYHSLLEKAIPPDRYFAAHPEYFALSNGKRRIVNRYEACYCLSNPEVRKIAADYMIAQIRKKKDMGLQFIQGCGMADLGQGWCECAECLKMNEGKEFDWKNISTLYNKAFHDILGQVLEKCPDAKLMIWAYHTYRKPPRAGIVQDPRVACIYMTHGRCYAHEFDDASCPHNPKLYEWLLEYCKRYKTTGLYEYFLCSADANYVPQEIVQAHDLKLYHRLGITGWEEETFFEDSVYWNPKKDSRERHERLPSLWQWLYLTGKMLWNPELNAEQLLEDIESKYYGKAYPAMKKYHALRRKLWRETPNCFGYSFANMRLPFLLNAPDARRKLLALLDEATCLAGKDRKTLYRIDQDRYFLKKYWIEANDKYKQRQANLLKAPTTSSPITIDGDGRDAAWRNAFYTEDFKAAFSPGHEKIPERLATSVGILSDENNLYFLITAREPNPEKMFLKGTPDGNVWQDDSIEILLHPQSISNEYYHWVITPKDVVYDARCPGNDKAFDSHVECKTTIHPDKYVMEVKIPARRLGDFKNGAVWKCNLARNRMAGRNGDGEKHYSLDGVLYHDISRFRPLQIGTQWAVNGDFSKQEPNRRKYPACLKITSDSVPQKWYANLPLQNAEFGIVRESPPYADTLRFKNVFACLPLFHLKKSGRILVSFEAKGHGKLLCAFTRYGKKGNFIKTDYVSPPVQLQPKWRHFTFEYTIPENEFVHLALNGQNAEVQIDNVGIMCN